MTGRAAVRRAKLLLASPCPQLLAIKASRCAQTSSSSFWHLPVHSTPLDICPTLLSLFSDIMTSKSSVMKIVVLALLVVCALYAVQASATGINTYD